MATLNNEQYAEHQANGQMDVGMARNASVLGEKCEPAPLTLRGTPRFLPSPFVSQPYGMKLPLNVPLETLTWNS